MWSRWVALAVALAWALVPYASEEEFVVWKEVRIVSAGRAETGTVVFEAQTDGEVYRKVAIAVFGKEYGLAEEQRAKLKGFPLSSIVVTHEAGYAELGGHTVHFRMKRVYYRSKKLLEERVRISVSKGQGLAIHGPETKEAK